LMSPLSPGGRSFSFSPLPRRTLIRMVLCPVFLFWFSSTFSVVYQKAVRPLFSDFPCHKFKKFSSVASIFFSPVLVPPQRFFSKGFPPNIPLSPGKSFSPDMEGWMTPSPFFILPLSRIFPFCFVTAYVVLDFFFCGGVLVFFWFVVWFCACRHDTPYLIFPSSLSCIFFDYFLFFSRGRFLGSAPPIPLVRTLWCFFPFFVPSPFFPRAFFFILSIGSIW